MKTLLLITALFLSSQTPIVHEKVTVYSVVTNQTDATFVGTLKLLEKKQVLGTATVSLKGFESQAIPFSWAPTTTSHTLTSELYDKNRMLLESREETFSISKSASDAEKKEVQVTSASSTPESSAGLSNAIAKVSPAASRVVTPALGATDTARNAALRYVDRGIAWSQKEIATQEKADKKPFGRASDSTAAANASTEQDWVALSKHYSWSALIYSSFYGLSTLRLMITNVALFYPLFAIMVFIFLWRTYYYFSTPRFEQY